jgi:hypothetical protein
VIDVTPLYGDEDIPEGEDGSLNPIKPVDPV